MRKIKTLAALKREANNGKMSLELIERYGKTIENFPERLKGIRKVSRANTVGLILINADGKESELRIESAKLIEYDGENLIVYQAGERDPNKEEKDLLDKWKRAREKYEKENPYSETFWFKKSFFEKSDYQYMSGFDKCRGKKYQYNGKVMDNSIKGNVILKYKVYMKED